MTIPNVFPNPDPAPGFSEHYCQNCQRPIEGDRLKTLKHCDHCRPGYIASRRYLHTYAARVYAGWIPDKSTPAPMTYPSIRDVYMTAGDLADFNHDWQRARFAPWLHGMEVLAAFRYGIAFKGAETVVLLCGNQFPIKYFVVDAAAKLDITTPSPDPDTWQTRKFPPAMPARNFVYDAEFNYSGGVFVKAAFANNDGVCPIRLTITYFDGDMRLATASNTFNRQTGKRRIKILAYHNAELVSDAAGVWGYTDALRDMANHLGTLARAGIGW